MPEQAEFIDDGADAKVPYIRYAPWEPTNATVPDLRRQLGILSQRVTHLEALVHKYINRDDQGGTDADSD